MATKKVTKHSETTTPKKNGAAKKNGGKQAPKTTEVQKFDEPFVDSMVDPFIAAVQAIVDEEFGEHKIRVEYGNMHFSSTAPGYGDISVILQYSEAFDNKIQAACKDLATKFSVSMADDNYNPKFNDRITVKFASNVDGKPVERRVVDWTEYAGKKSTDKDDEWDFTALKPEWLGQSFLLEWDGVYWYTIVGLNPDAKPENQVLLICDDTNSDDKEYTYRKSVDEVAERMEATSKMKLTDALKARKPVNGKKAA